MMVSPDLELYPGERPGIATTEHTIRCSCDYYIPFLCTSSWTRWRAPGEECIAVLPALQSVASG